MCGIIPKFFLQPLLLAICGLAIGQKKDVHHPHPITFIFTNSVGNCPIEADTVYQNSFGEPYTVTQLKYYISNISFGNAAGSQAKMPNTYFLINEQDSSSKSFTLATQASTISSIQFYIGVDSIKNVSGVQTGALDPLNGMFWTWQTGYIMAKLEATSPLSTTPQQRVIYHIGGFEKQNNVVKKITLPLPAPLQIKAGQALTIRINANINKWFDAANSIKIAEHQFCMNPGPLANQIAANYAAMFSLSSITTQ